MTVLEQCAALYQRGPQPSMNGHGSDGIATVRLAWEPVDLAPVLAGESVTPAPTVLARVDGVRLFYPGRLNGVMGEPESLKSWLVDFAAAQELNKGHHVITLDYEDNVESAVERLLALGVAPAAVLAHYSYFEGPPRLDELGEGLLAETIAERGVPTLAILDGVTEAMGAQGLDPDKGVDVARFFAGTPRAVARMGPAFVMVDHVVKSRENRGRWAIGSERKLSGLDGAAYGIEVLRPFGRERTGQAKITVAKDRCGHIRQHEGAGRAIAMLELRSWPDGNVSAHLDLPEATVDPDQPFRPTVLMERVSKTLEAALAPLSARAVRETTTGKTSTVAVALELLVAEAYVVTEAAGRGSVLHRSVRPFRADDDGCES